MDCFLNYIGLRHCGLPEPESGIYINDFAGISIKKLDNISDSERKTFIGVWERVQRRALLEIKAKILNRFMSIAKTSTTDLTQFGYFEQPTALPLGINLKGLYFYYYPSSWTKLNIPFIQLYSSVDYEEANFYVYDLNTGEIIKTITSKLTKGYNKVNLNLSELPKARYSFRLFIGYDSTLISLLQSVPNYMVGDYEGCHSFNHFGGYGDVQIQDSELTPPYLYQNIIQGHGSGISALVNIECSLDSFICDNRQYFQYAWGKILCAEIHREAILSDRTNIFTTLKADEAEAELSACMSDFSMNIGDVLDNMNIPSDGICFECNEQVRAVYGRP